MSKTRVRRRRGVQLRKGKLTPMRTRRQRYLADIQNRPPQTPPTTLQEAYAGTHRGTTTSPQAPANVPPQISATPQRPLRGPPTRPSTQPPRSRMSYRQFSRALDRHLGHDPAAIRPGPPTRQIRPPQLDPLRPRVVPPPPPHPELPDPNVPRGGALQPQHINMGPYSVPMKNLSQNQSAIHTQLMNLQEKASAKASYDDLVLNANLTKLRGVMGPWSQPLTPAKTFRSENFLYTGVDNKDNMNGDQNALGKPTRHYKIVSTKPVSTDPLNERDPDFQVYNPAITRLPGIHFSPSLFLFFVSLPI